MNKDWTDELHDVPPTEDEARAQIAATQAQVQGVAPAEPESATAGVEEVPVGSVTGAVAESPPESMTAQIEPPMGIGIGSILADQPVAPLEMMESPTRGQDVIPMAEFAEPLSQAPVGSATQSGAKKKRDTESFDWGKFLGSMGRSVSSFGSLGGEQFSHIGSVLQGIGSVVDMASSFGESYAEGAAGERGADSGLSEVIPDLATAAKDSGSTGSPDAQQVDRGDLHSLIQELIDTMKRLTEEMQKQHQKPGVQEDGSFVPSLSQGGTGAMGGIGEALGLSPGELQLIITMFRMMAMAA